MTVKPVLSVVGYILIILGFVMNFAGPVIYHKIKKNKEQDIKMSIRIKLIALAIAIAGIILLFI